MPYIKISEVDKTLTILKSNRAPGPDEIENETLKLLKSIIIKPLTSIFDYILPSGVPPKQWYLSEIILLHKKGDRTDINNYRPIRLSSNISEVFMKILKQRIYNTLDAQKPVE